MNTKEQEDMKINRRTAFEDLPENLTLREVQAWLGISRAATYSNASRGTWQCVRVGRLYRVPKAELRKRQ